jgi:hypothetical protein
LTDPLLLNDIYPPMFAPIPRLTSRLPMQREPVRVPHLSRISPGGGYDAGGENLKWHDDYPVNWRSAP